MNISYENVQGLDVIWGKNTLSRPNEILTHYSVLVSRSSSLFLVSPIVSLLVLGMGVISYMEKIVPKNIHEKHLVKVRLLAPKNVQKRLWAIFCIQ